MYAIITPTQILHVVFFDDLTRGDCLYVKTPVGFQNFERVGVFIDSKKESLL